MNYAKLVPVRQWVYDLFKVSYWTCEGGRLLKTTHVTATNEGHMWHDADDSVPGCEWMTYEIVQTNVGHPRVIGNMYGFPVYECGANHGKRLAAALQQAQAMPCNAK